MHELQTTIKLQIGVPQERQGCVRTWSEMKSYLSPLNPENNSLKFVRSYFRAQKHSSEEKFTKARRILRGLSSKYGYSEFREENPLLFKMVDIAVKKSTSF